MKKILMIMTLAVLTFACFAQEQNTTARVLTVEDAVSLALENNLSIKQSKMDLDLLALKDKYSWNSVSPTVSVGGTMNGSGDVASDPWFSAPEFSASLSLRLSLSPALATSIKSAKLAYEDGEMTLEATKKNIELSVRRTFYSLVYFNENLELQQRSLETSKQTYEANQKKYNQGRLSELDLLTSQYNYESRIPNVENLKTSYESKIDTFKVVLGLGLDEDIQLSGNLDDAIEGEIDASLLQKDLNDTDTIKSLLKKIEISENQLTATKYSAYGPSLTASASTSLSKKSQNAFTGKESGPVTFSYSLGVSIPLDGYLPWSTGALSVEQQEVSIEKQKQDLEKTKVDTEISIKESYSSISQAKTQLELYEKNVELMQKTYDMTKRAYEMGSSDLLSLQTAEDNLFQAKYNVTNQKYQIISGILELENTLGIPFGSLSTNKQENTQE